MAVSRVFSPGPLHRDVYYTVQAIYRNTEKTRFLARIYENKGSVLNTFVKYPFQGTYEGRISKVLLLCKLLKTGSEARIPSKISLLKDLTGPFLGGKLAFLPGGTRLGQNPSNCQRAGRSLLLSNS